MTDADWLIEDIPDNDYLFYRIHRKLFEQSGRRIVAGCFREQSDPGPDAKAPSMSTDWAKYSTPAESRGRATQPEENLIVSLPVGGVRQIDGFSVVHSPIQNDPVVKDNRSHTDVFGISRRPRLRDRLVELARTEIPLEGD